MFSQGDYFGESPAPERKGKMTVPLVTVSDIRSMKETERSRSEMAQASEWSNF